MIRGGWTALALALALAACGRLGFDPVPGAGADAAAPGAEWAVAITTTGSVNVRGLGADSAGNVYLGCNFSTEVQLEDGTKHSALGDRGALVASLSPVGARRWSNAYDATTTMDLRDFDANSEGASAGVGVVNGDVTVGAQMMSAGGQDPWLIRHRSDGRVSEATQFVAGSRNAQAAGVGLSENSRVAITGNFLDTVDLGGGNDFAGDSSVESGFTLVRDAATTVWAAQITEAQTAFGFGAAVAEDGSACFAGRFNGAIDFEGLIATSNGNADVWIAGFDPSGTARWLVAFGSSVGDIAFTVAIAPDGSCVIGGRHSGPTAGDVTLSHVDDQDGFIVSVDPNGAVRWSHTLGGVGRDAVEDVAIDEAGTIYVAGQFAAAVDIPGVSLTGADDAYVIALDGDGVALWSYLLSGTGDASGIRVSPTPGGVVVAGSHDGQLTLGTESLSAGTIAQAFVHQFVAP